LPAFAGGGGGGGGSAGGSALKNARTTRVPVIFTVHAMLVPQGALQWENAYPSFGDAVSVIFWPCRACSLHAGRQAMPAGDDVTVPFPVTATVSVGFVPAPAAAPASPSATTTGATSGNALSRRSPIAK
jgi:hypothetical protein